MRTAHVIKVRVGDDEHGIPLEQGGDVVSQRRYAEPGVNDQIAVAPPHMPDVGPKQGMDPWFIDPRNPVADLLETEPAALLITQPATPLRLGRWAPTGAKE